MWKALIDIGGYKKDEIVPDEKALIWNKSYVESPVVKTEDKPIKSADKPKKIEEKKKEKSADSPMLDDYLNRGLYVVKNAINGDDLDKETLGQLLRIEKGNKDRIMIVDILKKKLEEK